MKNPLLPHVPRFVRRHVEVRSDPSSWWLRNAHYMAHFSQVGLLLLAVFGYWYTVRPIHQRDLLDEQIAKMTQEHIGIAVDLDNARKRAEAEHRRAQAQQEEFNERLAKQRDDAIAQQTALDERLAKERASLLEQQRQFVARLEADKLSLRRSYEDQLTKAAAKTAEAQAETVRVQQLSAYRQVAQADCLRTHSNVTPPPTRDTLVACMTSGLRVGSSGLTEQDVHLAQQWISRESVTAMQSINRPTDEGIDFAWEALRNLADVRAACFEVAERSPFDPTRKGSGYINCSDLRAIAEQVAEFMTYYAAVLQAIETVANGVARRADASAPPALPNPPTNVTAE